MTAEQELSNLVAEFSDWTAANGLSEEGDAMDLLHHQGTTVEQREWLVIFITRWDETQARADDEYRAAKGQTK